MAAAKRIENDAYYTPKALTRALDKEVVISGRILECCAGNGAIAGALAEHDPNRKIFQSDLAWDSKCDATTRQYWESIGDIDWTVTNPPFNSAAEIIPLAYEHSRIGIAMLLRTTYSEPCANRRTWLAQHADNLVFKMDVNPRPKFRTDRKGSDSATVAWFVWKKDFSWKRLGVPSPFRSLTDWKAKQC